MGLSQVAQTEALSIRLSEVPPTSRLPEAGPVTAYYQLGDQLRTCGLATATAP